MAEVAAQQIDDIRFLGGILQEIENDFAKLDYEKTLRGFEGNFISEHAEHFSGRRDSSGSIWPRLADFTIAKKGHDIPLVETGEMKASVLNVSHPNHIGEYSHRGLLFGTEDEKGIYHQFGTRKIPQRAFIGMSEDLLNEVVGGVADHTVEGLKFTV